MSRGNRPRKAVKGGTDTSGEELFVIRALQKEELTPGKLAPSHSAAYVPFHGRECAHRDYEVLVADCNLEWVKCGSDSEKLPPGSIQGGYTKDGEPLYIGRAQHRDSVTCGKVRWSSKTCYLSWGGQEHLYQTFEVLTYQTIDLD
ncbi:hypothetical protein BIW11_04699 [Tropilaelaps mercedesae]|uniref:Natterin-3-like n=1 Tax=Tropilaelaps mercedesae TaxID=418985 RepID=A0A1V9X303_9ACAR|nr:hypothetical protein BIW11_04699 [Tropilaelaps mercedesae]